MIGLILAGGEGTRLYPINQVCTKQMLPIYDKPLIYYPLSNLILLGIRKFIIIIKPVDKKNLIKAIGNGKKLGIEINYVEQPIANGIPEALIIAEKFIKKQNILMILGDNIFYGNTFTKLAKKVITKSKDKCKIFLYEVEDARSYGVAVLNKKQNKINKIIEKPKNNISNFAITGLYYFDNRSIEFAKKLKRSKRNELEIIDLINQYKKIDKLNFSILERGFFWIDAGTPENMFKASQIIELIENRNKNKIACLEEICFKNNLINRSELNKLIKQMPNCDYKKNLMSL